MSNRKVVFKMSICKECKGKGTIEMKFYPEEKIETVPCPKCKAKS